MSSSLTRQQDSNRRRRPALMAVWHSISLGESTRRFFVGINPSKSATKRVGGKRTERSRRSGTTQSTLMCVVLSENERTLNASESFEHELPFADMNRTCEYCAQFNIVSQFNRVTVDDLDASALYDDFIICFGQSDHKYLETFALKSELEAVENQDLLEKQERLGERKTALEISRVDDRKSVRCPVSVCQNQGLGAHTIATT
ncbi:hypothetical protein E1301_Tti022013 [Triplophysa tibetana]|uniref:Uncharacterized protein n=1 Tax=Triplophysa tibetana TaxID=1572043 RepID=A0A5A9N050_9TELE|nr:hypothetical protein E1301_Tti022013 [Triplophysa tibetana]